MKTDVTSRAVRGRINIRRSKRDDTSRLRLTGVHDDQLEIIWTALEKARDEANTQYDTVALTYVCLAYLAGPTKKVTHGSDQTS